jgi:hypothetical protein
LINNRPSTASRSGLADVRSYSLFWAFVFIRFCERIKLFEAMLPERSTELTLKSGGKVPTRGAQLVPQGGKHYQAYPIGWVWKTKRSPKTTRKCCEKQTVVAYISRIKFLGYSFYENKKEGRLRIHPKSAFKMKERIKALTWTIIL